MSVYYCVECGTMVFREELPTECPSCGMLDRFEDEDAPDSKLHDIRNCKGPRRSLFHELDDTDLLEAVAR